MGLGHHHGERAFEVFLRTRRTPYVSVNEARRTLVSFDGLGGTGNLKNFDFVVYGAGGAGANLLVDIKCRRLPVASRPNLSLVGADGVRRTHAVRGRQGGRQGGRRARLESWVTREDIRSLRTWQSLFGPGFKAAFLFLYWCDQAVDQPPDGLFDEVFLVDKRWYAVRGVLLDDYEPAMQDRSARWQTVDLAPARFERLCDGFGRRWLAGMASPPLTAAAVGR